MYKIGLCFGISHHRKGATLYSNVHYVPEAMLYMQHQGGPQNKPKKPFGAFFAHLPIGCRNN
uniref:Uncharacterized protein n=1 Tax=Romanomermis culicivorax TaxID=13658 RepID=A0A915JS84_ROMCU